MSIRVVRTVAVTTDTSPVDLPPLYDAVDPEALDKLFEPGSRGSCSISFSYARTDVFIAESGQVHVQPADD